MTTAEPIFDWPIGPGALGAVYGQETQILADQAVAEDLVNLLLVAPLTVLLGWLALRGSVRAYVMSLAVSPSPSTTTRSKRSRFTPDRCSWFGSQSSGCQSRHQFAPRPRPSKGQVGVSAGADRQVRQRGKLFDQQRQALLYLPTLHEVEVVEHQSDLERNLSKLIEQRREHRVHRG